MEIEAAKEVVDRLPLPLEARARLRDEARLRSTHFSTRIEGNRLTIEQVTAAIAGKAVHARQQDVREVMDYWAALETVEEWAGEKRELSEDLIRHLHGIVESGPRAKPTPYRDGQNAIRDAPSGELIYLPPEAHDVPLLMADLVTWTHQATKDGLPIPLVAGLVHFQFVEIHPFWDGNGRTARLLATFLLDRGGYGLGGSVSVEEEHHRDLANYYLSLRVAPHHNYYEGHAEADLTDWLEYLCMVVARVFRGARELAESQLTSGPPIPAQALRDLDPRARRVILLFGSQATITTADIATVLRLSRRMARNLCARWVENGFLEVLDPSKKARRYGLTEHYRQVIGNG